MSKKLYELISNEFGSKFELHGKELTLDRITVGKLIELENAGQDIQTLMNEFSTRPASVSTKLGWLLLNNESKSEFKNDYDVFISCLKMTDLEVLSSAVIEAVNNSKPVEPEVSEIKNEVGVQN